MPVNANVRRVSFVCVCKRARATNTARWDDSDLKIPFFLLLHFPLCNKNVNWNKVCREICDYVCVWERMREGTQCVFADLRAFPVVFPHILLRTCYLQTILCARVCVCVRQRQLMPMHSDAEVESPGSARKVINFYLLRRVNCNFNRANTTTTPTAHINTEREIPHTYLVTHMQKPSEERVTTQQRRTGRRNISHTRSDYGGIPLTRYMLTDSATRTEWSWMNESNLMP